MLGKKMSQKNAKKSFLYSHEYRDQKMGEKNAQNNFSRNTRMIRTIMLGKKSSQKCAKNGFYIHTNIVTKKWWEKRRETIFPETHEWFEQKCWKKIVAKK